MLLMLALRFIKSVQSIGRTATPALSSEHGTSERDFERTSS